MPTKELFRLVITGERRKPITQLYFNKPNQNVSAEIVQKYLEKKANDSEFPGEQTPPYYVIGRVFEDIGEWLDIYLDNLLGVDDVNKIQFRSIVIEALPHLRGKAEIGRGGFSELPALTRRAWIIVRSGGIQDEDALKDSVMDDSPLAAALSHSIIAVTNQMAEDFIKREILKLAQEDPTGLLLLKNRKRWMKAAFVGQGLDPRDDPKYMGFRMALREYKAWLEVLEREGLV